MSSICEYVWVKTVVSAKLRLFWIVKTASSKLKESAWKKWTGWDVIMKCIMIISQLWKLRWNRTNYPRSSWAEPISWNSSPRSLFWKRSQTANGQECPPVLSLHDRKLLTRMTCVKPGFMSALKAKDFSKWQAKVVNNDGLEQGHHGRDNFELIHGL